MMAVTSATLPILSYLDEEVLRFLVIRLHKHKTESESGGKKRVLPPQPTFYNRAPALSLPSLAIIWLLLIFKHQLKRSSILER